MDPNCKAFLLRCPAGRQYDEPLLDKKAVYKCYSALRLTLLLLGSYHTLTTLTAFLHFHNSLQVLLLMLNPSAFSLLQACYLRFLVCSAPLHSHILGAPQQTMLPPSRLKTHQTDTL